MSTPQGKKPGPCLEWVGGFRYKREIQHTAQSAESAKWTPSAKRQHHKPCGEDIHDGGWRSRDCYWSIYVKPQVRKRTRGKQCYKLEEEKQEEAVSKARAQCFRPDKEEEKEVAQVGRGAMQGALPRRWDGKPGLVLISFIGTYLAEPSLFLHLLRFFFFFFSFQTHTKQLLLSLALVVFTLLSPPPPSYEATGWLLIVPRVPCHYVDAILPFGFYGTMARVLSSLVTMEALPPFLLSPLQHARRAAALRGKLPSGCWPSPAPWTLS